MFRLLLLAACICLLPTFTMSCEAVATRNAPDFFHWTCNSCDSKFGCCNKIQFTHQLARAKSDTLLGSLVFNTTECIKRIAALPDLNGMFSFVSYNRETSQDRNHVAPDHDFVIQQYRDGQWNSTLLPQFAIAPTLTSRTRIHSELSHSGGMHRTLSVNIFFDPLEIQQGSVSMLLVLTEDFFVDIEQFIKEPCVGEFESCNLIIHSESDEIINTEEPTFVSPQHTLRIEVLWTTPFTPEPYLSFALSIHSRYATPNGEYVIAKLPAPTLLDTEINDRVPMQQPLSVHIPAGYSNDYSCVTFATATSSLLGSILLLRELSRVSHWN